jgi:hypothetical protein
LVQRNDKLGIGVRLFVAQLPRHCGCVVAVLWLSDHCD